MSAETVPHTEDMQPETESGVGPRTVDWNNPRVAAILDAAAKCFARKGFSATTLAEIGRELGLRKSIVHYYFDSKAALIHEVQRYTYHRYLDHVRNALAKTADATAQGRATDALMSLWDVREQNDTGLNIEVWSASRNDAELRKGAAELMEEKRRLVSEGIADALGERADQIQSLEALSTLILAVLDGLSVTNYLEGERAKSEEAYRLFLYLLRLGIQSLDGGGGIGSGNGGIGSGNGNGSGIPAE
jgi:AcrR family transcriptional regulator